MRKFCLGPTIYMGASSLEEVLSGTKKAFIVTDKFMHKSGKVSYVSGFFDKIGAEYEVFSDVSPDPDMETVAEGIKRLAAFGADTIVAFGGGSAIDAAKSISHISGGIVDNRAVFVVIPTTSGTGSEVSRYAVITDRERNMKYPLADDSLLPDFAVLDVALVESVPPSVTADTGVDALTHAIEAFLSTEANDFSDAMAEKAMKLIFKNLPTAYSEPHNIEARQAVHNAATMAGVAFSNAGLGANHSLAHAAGAKLHLPHGRANAILLPYVMSFTAGCHTSLTPAATRYAQMAAVLSLDSNGVRQSALAAIRATRNLIRKLNIPASFHEAGVDKKIFEGELDAMTEAAMADGCMATAPVPLRPDEIKSIFRTAYSGKLLV
ncbi:1-propanol dehydrogenase PduQ [Cloacibacillus sp.]|uniref:1-propanol dehydrogenase PduQ n=1 Tax=Cloacibacillus sp. TaxID=2049023 RepID=UPI0025C0D6FC|nr:1-propanol dehydrogenase PduQ [Cloacibacillus sp.]MCC8056925.1 iron-containing alcohol dehydrogenase [Cloacibacillus sp.]MCC8178927.1 iron-containing alcohol dehydrogenase [Cloacibacillus sp.]